MENRSNNCKTQSNNRTASNSRSTHAANAANEHKHPNQYTKGADDEGAKNSKTIDSKSVKGSKNCR